MSGTREGRTVFGYIWRNFRNSIRPRQQTGNFMGEDYFGNKYFEIPAQPQIGKRRPERWFIPSDRRDENFDAELTAEWQSWLRHRRVDPPTEAELKYNLKIMKMKKINAAELDAKFSSEKEKPLQIVTGMTDFPRYEEYETVVGKTVEKKKKNDS